MSTATDLLILRVPKRRPAPTPWVISGIVMMLVSLGVVVVLSASTVIDVDQDLAPWASGLKQARFALIGLGLFILASRIPVETYRRYSTAIVMAAGFLLIAVIVPFNPLAVSAKGATRWLGGGGITFQPVEVAKFASIVFCADWMARRQTFLGSSALTVRKPLAVSVWFAALLMLQPDMGSGVLLVAVTLTIAYLAGGRIGPIARWAGVAAVFGAIAILTEPYRRRRMLAFLDPWQDPLDTGFQTIQSGISFASGGLFGSGIGGGRSKYGYLPEADDDLIFSVIGEELGLVGAVAVLAMFVALVYLGFRVARRQEGVYRRLVASGVTLWVGGQALINMGVATSVLPNKGISLPFVSAGGSALVGSMFAAGVLVSIARTDCETPDQIFDHS